MSYVSGEDRGQAALLPAMIEDYVAANAPGRVRRGAVRHVVGIRRGAISGNMKVSFQAARSIG